MADTGIVKRVEEVRREIVWLEKDEDGDVRVVRVEDVGNDEVELSDGDVGGEL